MFYCLHDLIVCVSLRFAWLSELRDLRGDVGFLSMRLYGLCGFRLSVILGFSVFGAGCVIKMNGLCDFRVYAILWLM